MPPTVTRRTCSNGTDDCTTTRPCTVLTVTSGIIPTVSTPEGSYINTAASESEVSPKRPVARTV